MSELNDNIISLDVDSGLRITGLNTPLYETVYWDPKQYRLIDVKEGQIRFRKINPDDKKYRVRLPDKESRATENVLCLRKRDDDGKVIINKVNRHTFMEKESCMLTEEEIRLNHEYLWQFADEV